METVNRAMLKAGKCYLGRTKVKIYFFKVIESAKVEKADLGGTYISEEEKIDYVEVRADGMPDICKEAILEDFIDKRFLTDAQFEEIEENVFMDAWNGVVQMKLTIRNVYEKYSDKTNIPPIEVIKNFDLPF